MTSATSTELSAGERARVGLCTDCGRARRIVSAKGSSFWLCERAADEPERFAKYPRLPVRACAGLDLREKRA